MTSSCVACVQTDAAINPGNRCVRMLKQERKER